MLVAFYLQCWITKILGIDSHMDKEKDAFWGFVLQCKSFLIILSPRDHLGTTYLAETENFC